MSEEDRALLFRFAATAASSMADVASMISAHDPESLAISEGAGAAKRLFERLCAEPDTERTDP